MENPEPFRNRRLFQSCVKSVQILLDMAEKITNKFASEVHIYVVLVQKMVFVSSNSSLQKAQFLSRCRTLYGLSCGSAPNSSLV